MPKGLQGKEKSLAKKLHEEEVGGLSNLFHPVRKATKEAKHGQVSEATAAQIKPSVEIPEDHIGMQIYNSVQKLRRSGIDLKNGIPIIKMNRIDDVKGAIRDIKEMLELAQKGINSASENETELISTLKSQINQLKTIYTALAKQETQLGGSLAAAARTGAYAGTGGLLRG